MIKDRKSKNILIGGLLIAVLIMVVAYASLAANLQINGTANVTSSWNVQIYSVTPDKTATNSGTQQNPNYTTPGDITHSITNNNLTANFDAALVSPGDTVTYTIVVKNNGTIDAMLNNITKTNSNNPAILFTVNGLTIGERLNAGASKTFTVVVRYSSSVTSQPTSTESALSVTLNYTQYDSSNAPSVVYSIAESGSTGMPIVAGTYGAWCLVNGGYNSCTAGNYNLTFQSESDCLSYSAGWEGSTCSQGTITASSNMSTSNSGAAIGKNVYLRHTVRNNIITGSDVCFIKGGVEYCLTAGESDALYNTNVGILQSAFTENNACLYNQHHSGQIQCTVLSPYIEANAYSGGVGASVDGSNGNWYCGSMSDGSFECCDGCNS